MGTHLTDKYVAYRKLDYYYQTVIIPSYIKYIMLIAYIINSREINFYFRQIPPCCIFCNAIPPLQRNT